MVSGAGFLFVKIVLRPRDDDDLDSYHFEFEDQHPQLARYNRWSRITFTAIVIAMLLLYLSAVL